MKEKSKLIVTMFILLILGFTAGYSTGFTKGVAWAVYIGLNFIEIDIDEQLLLNGIYQYKNNIAGCFEERRLEDARLYSYERD